MENERINLSLQMQDQAEKDRSKKIKIDVLESELKLIEYKLKFVKTILSLIYLNGNQN